jgi:AraC-like DNA-binding protein
MGVGDKTSRALADAGVAIDTESAHYILYGMKIIDFGEYIAEYPYGREGFYNSLCQLLPKGKDGVFYCVLHIAEDEIIALAASQKDDFAKAADAAVSTMTAEAQNILKANVALQSKTAVDTTEKLKIAYQQLLQSVPDEEEDSEPLIEKATKYIRENYNKDIYQDEVAEYVGLSVYHFSRLFKNVTKEKFIDYITKIRMENAQKMLAESNLKVAEVGQRVGYVNYSTFHRVFKAYAGLAPGEYRQKYGTDGGAADEKI